MAQTTTNGLVTVSRDRVSVTYSINEKSLFCQNGYKVLQSNYKSGFVKCDKGNINGRIRLTYDISRYSVLSELLPELTSRQYLAIINSLLKTAADLHEIGFLQHENISISPSDIFVDRATFKTYLIYLPLEVKTAPNAHMVFEKTLRENLVKMANEHRNVISDFTVEICRDLMDFKNGKQAIISKIQTQELQTGDSTSASKTGGLHRITNRTKTYTPEQIQPPVSLPPEQKASPNPKPQKQKKSTDPEKKKSALRLLVFFAVYVVVLVVIMFVVFNYYKNSGMTVSFIVFIMAAFLAAFMAPVIFLTGGKKSKKDAASFAEPELIEDKKKTVEDFISPIVLSSVNDAVKLEFFINKKEFTIGKVPGVANGTIPFDKTVGDTHCKIVWNNGFFVKDLESEYGTFVNEVRVVPGQNFPIKNGDRVRISKHYFDVREL